MLWHILQVRRGKLRDAGGEEREQRVEREEGKPLLLYEGYESVNVGEKMWFQVILLPSVRNARNHAHVANAARTKSHITHNFSATTRLHASSPHSLCMRRQTLSLFLLSSPVQNVLQSENVIFLAFQATPTGNRTHYPLCHPGMSSVSTETKFWLHFASSISVNRC